MRRTRFRVTFSDGTVTDYLAYTISGLYEALTREGAEVEDVEKVPRNTDRTRPRWELNPDGLERALAELGIKWPVRIRRTSSKEHSGCHRIGLVDGEYTPVHFIVADKRVTPRTAVRILLHELEHARQAERDTAHVVGARGKVRAWSRACARDRNIRYMDRPYEIEARAAEKRAPEFSDLTRKAR